MAKNNFRGMPGGMNQMAMMKQAQKMQQELLRMQEEQETKVYTASAGGGMVSASVNGKHEVVELTINPEAVDPDDVEMLQDMVIAAVNEANYTMIMAAQYWGHDIKFYPISWTEEDQVSNVKMADQAVKVLRMLKDYYDDPAVIAGEYRDKIIEAYEADPV